MVSHRCVKVIPLLSKKRKYLEGFLISENHFIQLRDFHFIKNNENCEPLSETSGTILPKECPIEGSDYNDEIANMKSRVSESLNDNAFRKKCNIEIISPQSAYRIPVLCCSTQSRQTDKNPVIISYFLKVDGQLFSLLALELSRSPSFRKAMINRLFECYCRKRGICKVENIECKICGCVWESFTVGIIAVWPNHCIMDKTWNMKMQILIEERCEIENAMSWLSTLGGAYSSLGDKFLYHAKKAEQVSIQQYKLALRLRDPLAVARCKIFFAMSLVQQGYFKQAKQIIRKQYKYAIMDEGRLDFRLANMCIAVWNKIGHLQNELS